MVNMTRLLSKVKISVYMGTFFLACGTLSAVTGANTNVAPKNTLKVEVEESKPADSRVKSTDPREDEIARGGGGGGGGHGGGGGGWGGHGGGHDGGWGHGGHDGDWNHNGANWGGGWGGGYVGGAIIGDPGWNSNYYYSTEPAPMYPPQGSYYYQDNNGY